jgi:Divergent InlB B-repeat domain
MDGKAGSQAGWVAPIALAILVGCLLIASPARAGTMVNVPATAGPADVAGTGFVDTGVSVQGSASISASGVINIGYGSNDTPDGDPTAGACSTQCPEPTFTYWSLIARIGNGPWQEVGSGPTTILGAGEVYLAVDDDGYGDNSGQWVANVTADPAQSDDPRLAVALDVQNGTVTSTSGSIDCGPSGTACFATFAPGAAVTLNAVADSGYTFTGWVGGGCTGSGACQVTSGSSNVVEATFAPSSATAPVLTLTNTDDHSGVEPRGSGATYTLTAGVSANSPAGENGPRLFTIYDPLPVGETLSAVPSGTGWNCDGSGGSEVRCTTISQATIAVGATLPAITVPVAVAPSAPSPLGNAAQVISSDAGSAVIASDVMTAAPSLGGSSPAAPTVGASAPQAKGSSEATFAGTVNPEGLATTAHFEYGLDPRYSGGGPVVYDQTTPTVTVGADSTSHSLSQVVAGLVPHAVYHVRLLATNSAGTVTSTDEVFTTGKAPSPPPPTLGKTENVEPISGFVFVKPPKAHATPPTRSPGGVVTGEGFIPLTQARQLPVGSEIDARRGTLQIVVATPERRHTQQARLSGGVFSIGQIRNGTYKGLTTFTLKENAFPGGPTYASCGVGKKAHSAGASTPVARAAKLTRKILQVLHASDNHGSFRTTGRYSAATVLGTQWTVADRCDGTLTSVKRGRVNVLDFHTGKTIMLRAGQSFLADAGR